MFKYSEKDAENDRKFIAKLKKTKKPSDNYRIFRIETDPDTLKEKQITMVTFQAKDDTDAYKYLVNYRRIANKLYTYYFDTAYGFVRHDKNGNPQYVHTMHDMVDCKHDPFYVKIWDAICNFFCRIYDVKYALKNFFYLNFTQHRRSESWDLIFHVLDDIIYNVPKMIADKERVPAFVFDDLNPNAKKPKPSSAVLDTSAVIRTDDDSPEAAEQFKKAKAAWDKLLQELLEHACLYVYYDNFGIVSEKYDAKPILDVHKKYKYTIPHVKGTYDRIDYAKLDGLKQREWNMVWNWMKAHGMHLWT